MKLKSLAVAMSLLASGTCLGGDLVIGADASVSNPLMGSAVFAKEAGKAIRKKILTLEFGDTITFTSFGDGRTDHIQEKSLQLSRRMPARQAAELVEGEIRNFSKNREGDGETHMLSFFEDRNFGCDKPGTEIYVIGDAIENSDALNSQQLVQGKALPKPFTQNLKGCAVTIIGAGLQGDRPLSREMRQNIYKVWTDWLTLAGATRVTIQVNP